jgi:hypothetical protein
MQKTQWYRESTENAANTVNAENAENTENAALLENIENTESKAGIELACWALMKSGTRAKFAEAENRFQSITCKTFE